MDETTAAAGGAPAAAARPVTLAVKLDAVHVDADGHVAGHDAGATLVRRLLRLFPGSVVVGPGPRRCVGFDLLPLEFVDAAATVVVNMDVLDSVQVWRTLHVMTREPRLMNFVWWPAGQWEHPVEQHALALSAALFPTLANSQRTAAEVRELVARLTVPPLAEQARVAWTDLGFRREHVRPRVPGDVEAARPTVLYPAIYTSERKNPRLFGEVVERVRARVPIRVEARLHENHLVSETALRWSRRDWMWVGPLTADRAGYWEALARTTAFLATASEESYGLEYVEALGAGVIGVLPDLPWARALVPEGYPFLWRTADEAERMLHRAVVEPEACRAELDRLVGGRFPHWVQERHDDDRFEAAVLAQVRAWFG